MSALPKWICLLAVIGLAACAPAAVAPPPPATAVYATPTPAPANTTAPADAIFLRYHRSGGIAGTDETWVIYTSGRVDYSGRGLGHASQLTSTQVAALLAAARSPEVAALKESYVPVNTCCDRFLHEITLTLDGRTQTVKTLDAAPGEPPALTRLLDTLNTALQ